MDLPVYYLFKTLQYLLTWSKLRLSRKRVSVARISFGYEYSRLHLMLRDMLGVGLEEVSVTLMEYTGGPIIKNPGSEIIVRKGD